MISESECGVDHAPASANVSRMKRVAGIVVGAFVVLAVFGLAAPSHANKLMSRITGYQFIEELKVDCGVGYQYEFTVDDFQAQTAACNGIGPNGRNCIISCTKDNPTVCNQITHDMYWGLQRFSNLNTNTFECKGLFKCTEEKVKGVTTKHFKFNANDPGFLCKGINPQPACFPGEASVQTAGGDVRISDLRVGDLVQTSDLVYEPVLGFLHQLRGGKSSFLTVSHSDGEFRATANHLVFGAEGSTAVGDLHVGDQIFVNPSAPSKILEVREGTSDIGLFAPLTASGTIVVDGVKVSIYGQPSMHGKLTHASAHAAFFPVRAYHALGLSRVLERSHSELHPFAELLFPLQFLLSK